MMVSRRRANEAGALAAVDGLVSVVMPSRNQAQFIRAAIDSVLGQNYPHVELVVVDGASTDGTVEVLRSFGDRVRWVSERDRNLAEAINKGIRMARGEFVHTLASDELLYETAISRFVEEMRSTGADVIVAQGHMIDEHSRVIADIDSPSPLSFVDILTLRRKMPLAFSFFRRRVVDGGPFDEDFVTCTDFLFWLNVLPSCTVRVIHDRVGAWRHHAGAWSVDPAANDIVFEARRLAFRKFFADAAHRKRFGHLWSLGEVGAYADLLLAEYKAGRFGRAVARFLECFVRHPVATVQYDDGIVWRRALVSAQALWRARLAPGS